jgi:putative ABC transport system permease protein
MAFARFSSLLRNLLRRSQVDRDLDAELQACEELIVDEKVAAGLSATDARRLARAELGALDAVKANVRQARAGASIDRLRQDLSYAARRMRRNPGFSCASILTMSLGAATVIAVFAIAHALLFNPPAGVPRNPRLVALDRFNSAEPGPLTLSLAERTAFLERTAVFDDLAASNDISLTVRIGNQVERIDAEAVTGNYFDVLGIRPVAGHLSRLGGTDGLQGAVVSDRLLERFGITREIVGQPIMVSGHPFPVVGITPAVFGGLESSRTNAQIWLTIEAHDFLDQVGGRLRGPRESKELRNRWRAWELTGLLRPEQGTLAAQAHLREVARQVAAEWGEKDTGATIVLRPGLEPPARSRARFQPVALLTLAAVMILLVIAASNVANLTLAQTLTRSRELAVRLSLGASRGRLVRQMLTESLVLSTLACSLGLVLARWLIGAVSWILPEAAARVFLGKTQLLDWRVLLFVVALACLAAAIAGLAPAWHGARVSLLPALKDLPTVGPRVARTRIAFVTIQVALAVVLLVASGLLVRALQAAYAVPLGFETENLVLADLTPEGSEAEQMALVTQLLDAFAAQPDIATASIALKPPLQGGAATVTSIRKPGEPPAPEGRPDRVLQNVVAPGYFDTLEIRVLRGRPYGPRDAAGADQTLIVNEALARRLWPTGDALGESLQLGFERTPRVIVGIVGNAQHIGLTGRYAESLYLPLLQHGPQYWRTWTLHLRARTSVPRAVDAARRAVASIDPNLPLFNVRAMDDQFLQVVFPQRTFAIVTFTFGVLALLLTAAGLAAGVAYSATQRTHEIGIRIALGARRGQVLRLVLRQGLTVTAAGVTLGLVLAVSAASMLRSMFFGVSPLDPQIAVAICVLLAAVALCAGLVPARRASRIDPAIALRRE